MKTLRWLHLQLGFIFSIPLIIIVISGALLMLRGKFSYLRPTQIKYKNHLSYDQFLSPAVISNFIKERHLFSEGEKITTLNYNIEKGMIIVRTNKSFEYHIAGDQPVLLASGENRAALLYKIHEGTFFGDFYEWGVTFVCAFVLFFLVLSGLILYMKRVRWRKRK